MYVYIYIYIHTHVLCIYTHTYIYMITLHTHSTGIWPFQCSSTYWYVEACLHPPRLRVSCSRKACVPNRCPWPYDPAPTNHYSETPRLRRLGVCGSTMEEHIFVCTIPLRITCVSTNHINDTNMKEPNNARVCVCVCVLLTQRNIHFHE